METVITIMLAIALIVIAVRSHYRYTRINRIREQIEKRERYRREIEGLNERDE